MTGEDLGYKPGVVEKVKFGYSSLGEALNSKVKNKTDRIVKIDKQDKVCFIIHRIALGSLKMSMILKECHLILCIKGCKNFIKNLLGLKKLVYKQKK